VTNALIALKKVKWWLWVALGLGFSILLFVLHRLFTNPSDGIPVALPAPPQALVNAVNQAAENALQAQAQAAAVNDTQKQQLTQIGTISDDAARRQALANWLNTLNS
jgi:hypothetical protein